MVSFEFFKEKICVKRKENKSQLMNDENDNVFLKMKTKTMQ